MKVIGLFLWPGGGILQGRSGVTVATAVEPWLGVNLTGQADKQQRGGGGGGGERRKTPDREDGGRAGGGINTRQVLSEKERGRGWGLTGSLHYSAEDTSV